MSGRQVRTQLVVWTDDGLFPLLVRRERREERGGKAETSADQTVGRCINTKINLTSVSTTIVCGVHSTNT